MALAVPLRKDADLAERILAGIGSLCVAVGAGKIGLALIGRAQKKDDTAFGVLQSEIAALRERVVTLETQAVQERREHASESGQLRQELAEANGENRRLTILTVQQAARIQDLEAKVAERSLTDPAVAATARKMAQDREGLE